MDKSVGTTSTTIESATHHILMTTHRRRNHESLAGSAPNPLERNTEAVTPGGRGDTFI
jgi:hypothetical protein